MRTRVSFALRRIELKLDSLDHTDEKIQQEIGVLGSVAHLLRFWHLVDIPIALTNV